MKRFYFDLETTGTSPAKHGIHQIAGCIEIDGEVKEQFNFNVRPNPKAAIEDEALAVSGKTRDQIEAYPPMDLIYKALVQLLGKYCDKFDKGDKYTLVGYNNNAFDNQFLRGFFLQNGDQYFGSWFWPNSIDAYVTATVKLEAERSKLKDFKLKTVAAHLGIPVDETRLHDANYDIELTKEILKRTT